MYVVIFCSLLALLLTYLESKHRLRGGMKLGFILVTLLGVIHYDYGNDYMSYYDIYKSIVNVPFNLSNLIGGYIYKEPGWALINYAFKPIGGFFMMVAVLNVIQNVIYYRFIKDNVALSWWPMAIFIYLFSGSFYLLNFSMMRQGLAIAIFLAMWKYIKTRRWVVALIGLILASTIHSSALILLPFAFWGFLRMNNGKIWAILYVVLFCVLWSAEDFINRIFETVIVFEEFQDYSNYLNDAEDVGYGIGFLINMLPFFVSIYYLLTDQVQAEKEHQLVAIATVGFMILPFSQIIPLIGRVGMYFNVFSIGAFTKAYSSIKYRYVRYGLVCIFVFMTLYDYWLFFNVGVFSKSYSTFHTIFSAF
mgnify:CR=1 FL=1